MIAAGFGMRREVDTAELVALFERALREAGLDGANVACFATLRDRAGEPAFCGIALRFGVAARAVDTAEMARVTQRLATHSARVERLHGVGSVAEAAALVAAGVEARLVLPRIASKAATCAIAESTT